MIIQYLAIAHEQSVNIYAISDFTKQATFEAGVSGIKQLLWSNDSTRLAGVSAGNTLLAEEDASRIFVWDIQQETTIIFQPELIPNYLQEGGSAPQYIYPTISDILWSLDNRQLILIERDYSPFQTALSTWDSLTGQRLSFEIYGLRLFSLQWMANGQFLIGNSTSQSGHIYTEVLYSQEEINFADSYWQYSSDHTMLAGRNWRDNLLRIYDANTLKLRDEYGGENGRISDVTWSPNKSTCAYCLCR